MTAKIVTFVPIVALPLPLVTTKADGALLPIAPSRIVIGVAALNVTAPTL